MFVEWLQSPQAAPEKGHPRVSTQMPIYDSFLVSQVKHF